MPLKNTDDSNSTIFVIQHYQFDSSSINLKGYRYEHIVSVDSGYFDVSKRLARSPLRFPDEIS